MRTEPYVKAHPECSITDTHFYNGMAHFRIATVPYIGGGGDAEKLYQLEKSNAKHRELVFKELGRVLGIPQELYWTEIVPEGLASIIDSYEPGTAIAAAIGYLRRQGFEVSIPQP